MLNFDNTSAQQTVSWAIVGTSFISDIMAKAICSSNNGKLKAIVGRDLARAQDLAMEHGADTVYENITQLLSDTSIDAIYIALPNHLHFEWTVSALQAGKAVLCEKPLVISSDEMTRLMEVAKQTQSFCMEAIMYRCHPLALELKRIVDSKKLGDIQLLSATYTADIVKLANPTAGGALNNLGCYPISLVQYLMGAPITVKSVSQAHQQHTHNDTASVVLLQFPFGAMAQISTSDAADMHWEFSIIGSLGRLSMISNPWLPEPGEHSLSLRYNGDSQPEIITVSSPKSAYTHQIDVFNEKLCHPDLEQAGFVSLQESEQCIATIEKAKISAG
jgi:predicted dehydrogenase